MVERTRHQIIVADSRSLSMIGDKSIDLVVTSPPYPLIAMWDGLFRSFSSEIGRVMDAGEAQQAFELMHRELDKTWCEILRVLKDGGFACINIGDAVRGFGGRFQLFPNHARVISAFTRLGFNCLPAIIWRKQANTPTKFMGSGMLPAGAYVTLEHEYILIFRKGTVYDFSSVQLKQRRLKSAFFWEERNLWFSDVWDFKGIRQHLDGSDLRKRSAAFPLELPFRLINMYSLQGDWVLDPFAGIGTTMVAALAACRNSIGIELDAALAATCRTHIIGAQNVARRRVEKRIADHLEFVNRRKVSAKTLKYFNPHHQFPVITRQETGLQIPIVSNIYQETENVFIACYRRPILQADII